MDATPIVAWLAPILSTIIITAATASINAQVKRHEVVADERHAETEAKRKAEVEWREAIDKLLESQGESLRAVAEDRDDWLQWRERIMEQMEGQDRRIDTVLALQCSQTRSDILHKCHRYLDDIGKASTEEKQALKAEHDDYAEICKANGIENEFIDLLVQRVMELPEREV